MSNYNFPEGNSRFSLVNRIYDSGKGEKFNDLTNNQLKPKGYKAFLTNEDDLSDVLVHLDKKSLLTKNITKSEKIMKDKKKQTEDLAFNSKKTNTNLPKPEQYEFSLDKNDIIHNKKFELKQIEEASIEEASRFFNPERNEKKIQEIASITGYKTISPLPPSRGRRDNSYNPMIDRFKATAGDVGFTKTNSKFGVSIYSNPLEPKLSKPTTTIIDLDDNRYPREDEEKDNIAISSKKHIDYNTNIPMNSIKDETENYEDDKNLMTINNLLNQTNEIRKVNYTFYLLLYLFIF
jgi:hypothetical protein